jgi:hypothetical protein
MRHSLSYRDWLTSSNADVATRARTLSSAEPNPTTREPDRDRQKNKTHDHMIVSNADPRRS